jgi:hypothetical protein
MRVRERPPLRLIAEIAVPGGGFKRWSEDAHQPGDIESGLSFSTTMPGGFEQAQSSLARRYGPVYADLTEFSTVRWVGVGGLIAFEGRLQASPRLAGDQQMVTPEVVGWQSHLDDNTNAGDIYLDADFNQWQPSSVQLKINDAKVSPYYNSDDPSVNPDPTTGYPSLVTGFSGAWQTGHLSKGWYDAKGLPIGAIYYAWKRQMDPATASVTIDSTDSKWNWGIWASTDDLQTSADQSGNLRAAGPGQGSLATTAGNKLWGEVYLTYSSPGGSDGVLYGIDWTYLAVVGSSGVPIRGALTANGGLGVLASDVIVNVLGRWAPKIGYTTGPFGSIQPTSYLVPQASYRDPQPASTIIQDMLKYELADWAVWEGPTFYLNPWGMRGRRWQARVRETQLQDAGPQVDRLFNGVIVTYTDPTGIARSVGPPGSGLPSTDPTLADPDPLNPATLAGLTRYSPPFALGTSTRDIAVKMGQRYLQELKAASTQGQASLMGYVEDSASGLWFPSWMARAGDWISFVDASDTSFRRIIRTAYDDGTKTNAITLDSPPNDMQQMLERLNYDASRIGV